MDCCELDWSRNTSIKRLSHGWLNQIKETFSTAFLSWYVDVSVSSRFVPMDLSYPGLDVSYPLSISSYPTLWSIRTQQIMTQKI